MPTEKRERKDEFYFCRTFKDPSYSPKLMLMLSLYIEMLLDDL